ncbi:hypothetical protein UlMin_015233 [Ulmus minor]
MASNNFLKSTDRNAQKRIDDVHDIDAFNKLAAQVALLNNNFKNLNHANAISLRSGKELDPPKQVGQQSLHINLPFVDMLEQMPKYAKFLKDVLSNKRKLEECEAVALTEETTALLQKKLPPKLKDPGSFSIPCTIGENFQTKALCDLGASINLMPLSIFRKLGLEEPTPTMVSLVMADRSIKHPRGIVEDVLVKVGRLIFLVDFIILDMKEDKDISVILGRPFLATGGAIIDVK